MYKRQIQSYAPDLHPLLKYGIDKVLVCTYQAISGAGKTFERWPEMVDNLIPYIGGEEEKSEQEPLKVWGKVEGGKIVKAEGPAITAQCLRVPVSDGHTAAVFVSFKGCLLYTSKGFTQVFFRIFSKNVVFATFLCKQCYVYLDK